MNPKHLTGLVRPSARRVLGRIRIVSVDMSTGDVDANVSVETKPFDPPQEVIRSRELTSQDYINPLQYARIQKRREMKFAMAHAVAHRSRTVPIPSPHVIERYRSAQAIVGVEQEL